MCGDSLPTLGHRHCEFGRAEACIDRRPDGRLMTSGSRAFGRRLEIRASPPILIASLALIVTAALYARSLDNYFQSDDFDWLHTYGQRAAAIGTFQAVLALPDSATVDPADPFTWNYRPTTALVVNVLFRLFGVVQPIGYHVVLIGGHLAASALAGLLARRLTRCSWVGVAVTAVFGLHFAHVETVAWFGSIAEVLGGVLALGAALAFLQFRESGRTRWAWTTVGMYGLALGANPTAAPILGFFLLVDLWRLARGLGLCWSVHWIYIPVLMLAGGYLAIEAAALGVAGGSGGYGYSLGPRLLLNAIWYPTVLVAPFTEPELFDVHQALLALLDGTGSFAHTVGTAQFLPVLAVHFVVISAAGLAMVRGPGWARVAVGAALALEAPFVLLDGTMFHFAYLPAAFVLTLGVAALAGTGRAISSLVPRSRAASGWLFVVAAGLLAWHTHSRLNDWEFAAGLSHRLVQSAHSELGELPAGSTVIAADLPNTVNGAYVFREGFPAALQVTYGRADLKVQTFSRPVVMRLMSESGASDLRYFLTYEPSDRALRLQSPR